ncbi:MAG: hypothetical protein ACJ77R_01680 [Gemmatimonadaceae bacterium]
MVIDVLPVVSAYLKVSPVARFDKWVGTHEHAHPTFSHGRKMRLGLIFGIVLLVLLVVIMWNRGRPPAP